MKAPAFDQCFQQFIKNKPVLCCKGLTSLTLRARIIPVYKNRLRLLPVNNAAASTGQCFYEMCGETLQKNTDVPVHLLLFHLGKINLKCVSWVLPVLEDICKVWYLSACFSFHAKSSTHLWVWTFYMYRYARTRSLQGRWKISESAGFPVLVVTNGGGMGKNGRSEGKEWVGVPVVHSSYV